MILSTPHGLALESLLILIKYFWLKHSEADHSVFYCHTSLERRVYMILYVYNIVITKNDATKIAQIKQHLCKHFKAKDLVCLKYFLGIEIAQSK